MPHGLYIAVMVAQLRQANLMVEGGYPELVTLWKPSPWTLWG